MSRGQQNIIFKPPVIRKTKQPLFAKEEVVLPGKAKEVILLQNKILLRDQDDVIYQLDNDYKSLKETVAIPEKAMIYASEEALVWGDEDGFVISNPNCKPRTQFKGLPTWKANPISVFANKDRAYLLWENEELGKTFLSSSSLFNDSGWSIIRDYGKSDVKIVSKGKRALIQSKSGKSGEELYSFEVIEERKDKGSLKKISGGSKASSRGGSDTLLAIDNDLVWSLSQEKNSDWILAFSPSHPFFFEDRKGKTWHLRDRKYKSLKASGGCAALLLENRLMLFTLDGREETLLLEKEWDEISLLDNKILLWDQSSSDALLLGLDEFLK